MRFSTTLVRKFRPIVKQTEAKARVMGQMVNCPNHATHEHDSGICAGSSAMYDGIRYDCSLISSARKRKDEPFNQHGIAASIARYSTHRDANLLVQTFARTASRLPWKSLCVTSSTL